MNRIVFLLEERSMKALLDCLLPRLMPGIQFICVPHEGKQDLEKSIPRKLAAWREPDTRFVIVRDNDGGDCSLLKRRLTRLCVEARRPDALVRIACQELEAWYFGDPEAMSRAFGNQTLKDVGKKARYRDPDAIKKPSREILRLIPEFQKISGARRMGEQLGRDNGSRSFRVLMNGIERLLADC